MIRELVRKDLRLFAADRRGIIVSIGVPIVLASFMAVIYGGIGSSNSGGGGTKMNAVPVALVDEDRSAISRGVAEDLAKAGMVEPRPMSADDATNAVRTGKLGTALILPAGFGEHATTAIFGGDAPSVRVLYDPSKSSEAQIVRGALMQSGMQVVTREAFSDVNWPDLSRRSLERIELGKLPDADRAALRDLFASLDRFHRRPTSSSTHPSTRATAAASMGMAMPFKLAEEPMTAARSDNAQSIRRAGVVHAFVGMTVQGILFFSIEAAMGLLRDRNRGIWRRFRAAPVSRFVILIGRAISGTVIGCVIATAVFLAGAGFFHLRVEGSFVGFLIICLGTALMSATFGLVIATLGRTEQQARGFSILAVLLMVMIGGAWMPTFLMPKAIQQVGVAFPTRWAVEGMDAMTWRGLGMAHVLMPVAILLGFSVLFAAFAWARFRWETE
jgi:ABC-2 type transport system permease protein